MEFRTLEGVSRSELTRAAGAPVRVHGTSPTIRRKIPERVATGRVYRPESSFRIDRLPTRTAVGVRRPFELSPAVGTGAIVVVIPIVSLV